MRFFRTAMVLWATAWLVSCSAANFELAPVVDDAMYQQVFPYYAELCALSEIKKRPGFGPDIEGGIGGHSALYLNGACRVTDAHYPELRLCSVGRPGEPEGAGISVNAHFRNANWVATDGRAFFFQGGLRPEARLTRAAYVEAQRTAKRLGILDGILFHESAFEDRPPGVARLDYMYELSISTDYAVGFGRGRYCARVPVSRMQMAKIVAFLNHENEQYRRGHDDYRWSVLQNNCSHLAHNALAAAGVWDEWKTGRFVLFAAFDFPVPKNEFVNLMRRTNDAPVEDLAELYEDLAARGTLLHRFGLPTVPGALAESVPAQRQNDVYDTKLGLIFYDEPNFGPYHSWFRDIFTEPRYVDLSSNLAYFAGLYEQIKAGRKPLAWWLDHRIRAADQAQFAMFYAAYYAYVDRESVRTGAQIRAVEGLSPHGLNTAEQGIRLRMPAS